jgi:hypothetical protein
LKPRLISCNSSAGKAHSPTSVLLRRHIDCDPQRRQDESRGSVDE